MSEDFTVLLVGDDDPDEKLIEQLEKKGLVVEFSNVKEFSSLLALVEPHIVVHVGKAGAEQTTRLLKEAEIVRRVRLIILADRDDLASLRDLDRSVVISLLASDIAPSVVAARVQMLAKKGPEKSLRPPKPGSGAKTPPSAQQEAPPPPEAAPRAVEGMGAPRPASKAARLPTKAAPTPLLNKGAAPRGAEGKSPLSPKPPELPRVAEAKSPLSPKPLEPPRAAPRPALSKAAGPASPRSAAQAAPPSSSKERPQAVPPPLPEPLPLTPIASSKLAPVPPHEANASSERSPQVSPSKKSEPEAPEIRSADAPPVGEMDDFRDENTVVYEASLPLPALASPTPRVLVADNDVTRADLIACALRRAGLEARIAPLDAAATHWNLLRSFAPTVVVGDVTVLQTSGQVWLQLLRADQALKKAKLVQAPFGRLFDVHDGSVNLRTLVPQIPQLSGDVTNEAKPTRGPKPPPAQTASNSKEEDISTSLPEPSPDSDDDFESEFERLTVSHPNDFAVPREARSSYPPPLPDAEQVESLEPGQISPRNSGVPDVGDLDLESLPPTIPPTSRGEGDFRDAPTIADTESTPSAELPPSAEGPGAPAQRKKSRGFVKGLLAALVLGGTAAGIWLALGKSIGPFSLTSLHKKTVVHAPPSAAHPASAQVPAAQKAAPIAPQEPAKEPGDPLWIIPAKEPVQTCEELVVNLEELKVGGIQQASFSWARAQKSMVVGDLDKAQVLMCEAVLIHPESLALEGLASLYLTKRAPEKAKVWIDQALEHRPKRSQTLEVASDVYSQLGQVDAAKKVLANALKVAPTDQGTLDQVALQYLEQADLSLRSGALERAELLYRRAATISPTNANAAAGMAAIHAQAGTTEGAQLWAEKTLSLDDSNPVALVVQASLATEGGDTDRAIELCKHALKRDPTYLPAIQLLSKLQE